MKAINNKVIDLEKEYSTEPVSVEKVEPISRIIEFDYLRGVAIILIVVGHSVFNAHQGFPVWLANILMGGTGVFVFISGFFFHYVFSKKFNYRKFIKKKAQNVFLPFLVVSTIAIVLMFFIGISIENLTTNEALEYCWQVLQRGYVLFPHWYIPFIMATFLCSGLHIRYLTLSAPLQAVIWFAFTIVAMLIHRPQANINVLQSLVYFTPYYLLGMLYSQHLGWFRKNYRFLLIISCIAFVASDWLQSYVWTNVGDYQKPAFSWGGIDLQFIQKLALCIILVGICNNFINERVGRHLNMLAALSFGVFFLHPFLAMVWGNAVHFLLINNIVERTTNMWCSLVISLCQYLYLMYGTVWVIKKIKPLIGSNSRMFIGV